MRSYYRATFGINFNENGLSPNFDVFRLLRANPLNR